MFSPTTRRYSRSTSFANAELAGSPVSEIRARVPSANGLDYDGHDLDSNLITDNLRGVIKTVEETLEHGSGILSALSETTLALLQMCPAILDIRIAFKRSQLVRMWMLALTTCFFTSLSATPKVYMIPS